MRASSDDIMAASHRPGFGVCRCASTAATIASTSSRTSPARSPSSSDWSLASGGASTPQRCSSSVRANTWLAGPSARTCPSPSRTTREARLATPRMSWVTVTTVSPVRARTRSSSRRNARMWSASCPVVGSSRTSTPRRTDQQRGQRQPLPATLAQLPRAVVLQVAEAEELDRPGTSSTGSLGRARNRMPNSSSLRTVVSNSMSSAACSSSATCAACSKTLPGRTCWPRPAGPTRRSACPARPSGRSECSCPSHSRRSSRPTRPRPPTRSRRPPRGCRRRPRSPTPRPRSARRGPAGSPAESPLRRGARRRCSPRSPSLPTRSPAAVGQAAGDRSAADLASDARASAASNQVSRTASIASSTDSGAVPGNASGTAWASRTTSGMPTPVAIHSASSSQAPRGGRSRTIRPSSISTTRSAHGTTSSTRCSMTTMPVPSSLASRRSVPSTSWAPTGSRSDSGSSRTSRRRAHGQRRRDGGPLLLTAGQRDGRGVAQPGHAGDIQAPVHPRGDLRLRQRQVLRAERHLGLHGLVDQLQVRVLEHQTDQLRCLVRRQPAERPAAEAHPAAQLAVHPGRDESASASASVDLPQPEAPVTSTTSPAATPKSTCRNAAWAAPR